MDNYLLRIDSTLRNGLSVRRAETADVRVLLSIFERARRFMAANGNPTQWADGYPDAAQVRADVAAGHCYAVVDKRFGVVGTFCLLEGRDPTYDVIVGGSWLDDAPYATIHRLASAGVCRGVGRAVVEWALSRYHNVRIDTHTDNAPMLALLRGEGFVRCGTIYCRDGSPRVAFQRHDE